MEPMKSTLGALALCVGALVLAGPATASEGVKYVHLEPVAVDCSPGNALPCPFPPGTPQTESNVLYVEQTEDQNGKLHFNSLSTNTDDDTVWLGLKYEAKCKTGYRLHSVNLKTGYEYASGEGYSEVTECDGDCPHIQSEPVNPDNKTIPWRHRPFYVPVSNVLSELELTEESLYAYGEALIADRVADGMSEADARAQTEDFAAGFPVAAVVTCERIFPIELSADGDSYAMPLMIRYLGHGEVADLQPSDPTPPPGIDPQFVDQTSVTQAVLFAVPDDSENGCGLNLSAVFTTNDETTIEYRLVNELGVKSQVFHVPVDQTYTAYVNHWIDLTDTVIDSQDLGLVAPSGSDGELDLTTEDTDRVQGYFQVEVILPHHKMSNIASYNLPACKPDPVAALRTE